MTVRSIDGENLGRVFAVHDGEFLIEKGLFFPKDYVCRYAEVSDIRDGEVILLHGKEGLHRFSFDEEHGVLAGTGGGAGVGPGAVGIPAERSTSLGATSGLTAHASAEGVERPRVDRDEEAVPVYSVEDAVRREQVDLRRDEDVEAPRKLDLTSDDPNLRRS
ncbi:hypothetical protein [Hyalangium versicolor]|uniref:hypothetical protein n=1 Tax=Hyalangium versicolor TaxID=2861190 RepID=UPI001CCE6FB0|nr:hypothetical protein [Hyalangium versicolor]